MSRTVRVTPSAARLVTSLRSIGYEPATAVADLVDNSVSAGATEVSVRIDRDHGPWRIVVADNGSGIRERDLDEAMRFGTRRNYGSGELGRFGLGMKTASTSLGRRVTVVTRTAPSRRRIRSRVLDLDHVERTDRWEVLDGSGTTAEATARSGWLNGRPGTVVVIEELDRAMATVADPAGSGGTRRMKSIARRVSAHLGAVFHRFLEAGELVIGVNGQPLSPWNPFAPQQSATEARPVFRYRLNGGGRAGEVTCRPYILPARHQFRGLDGGSGTDAFDTAGGPRHWNRQQGIYIYRADRMIQSGGWCGLRAVDEHTKLARVALDFPTDLDPLFALNVSKMRVVLPPDLKAQLERPIGELCRGAERRYRSGAASGDGGGAAPDAQGLGWAARVFRVAAHSSDQIDAYEEILDRVAETDAAVATEFGWEDRQRSAEVEPLGR